MFLLRPLILDVERGCQLLDIRHTTRSPNYKVLFVRGHNVRFPVILEDLKLDTDAGEQLKAFIVEGADVVGDDAGRELADWRPGESGNSVRWS